MQTDLGQAVGTVAPSVVPAPRKPRFAAIGDRLRSVVLLGGAVRHTDLSRSIGRSMLDLPVSAGATVLDHWQEQAAQLALAEGASELPLRVMIDRASTAATVRRRHDTVQVSIENDAVEYRGTGGLLRDLALGYDPTDVVLVANACQVLLQPLPRLFNALVDAGGDINLIAHEDGTPVGLMLVSCRALADIRGGGFVDFKEQALPELAKRFDVRVVSEATATARPIRTLGNYLTALWMSHRVAAGHAATTDPFGEDWFETFGIVEPGAHVDPTARAHDSVVLRGGTVGAGAVLVRSVVCAGGSVRPGEVVCDRIVTARRLRDRILRR